MMRFAKRTLSWLLVLTLFITLLQVSVLAAAEKQAPSGLSAAASGALVPQGDGVRDDADGQGTKIDNDILADADLNSLPADGTVVAESGQDSPRQDAETQNAAINSDGNAVTGSGEADGGARTEQSAEDGNGDENGDESDTDEDDINDADTGDGEEADEQAEEDETQTSLQPRTESLNFELMESADMLESEGWKWERETSTLTLNGLNLYAASDAAAMKFGASDSVKIILHGENTIISGTSYGISAGGLSICGAGTLGVSAAPGASSVAVSAGYLTVNGGVLRAYAGAAAADSFGVYAGSGITITGGMLIASAGSAANSCGIYLDSAAALRINGGEIYADGAGHAIYINNQAEIGGRLSVLGSSADGYTITSGFMPSGAGQTVCSSETGEVVSGVRIARAVEDRTLYFNNGALRYSDSESGDVADDISGWSAEGTTLTLDGFQFTTTSNIALHIPSGATIVLAGTNAVQSTYSGGESSYGVYAPGAGLTLTGSGALYVSSGAVGGEYNYGLAALGGLAVDGGSLSASSGAGARSAGLMVSGRLTVSGGTVYAAGGSGYDGSAGIYLSGSCVAEINGGEIHALAGSSGNGGSHGLWLSPETSFKMGGGTLNATGGEGKSSYGVFVNGARSYEINAGTLNASGLTGAVSEYTKPGNNNNGGSPGHTTPTIPTVPNNNLPSAADDEEAEAGGEENEGETDLALYYNAEDGSFRYGGLTGELYPEDGTWSAEGNTLTLTNFHYTTPAPVALYLNGDCTIIISGTNTIISEYDGAVSSRGLHCTGELTIKGDGTINITSGQTDAASASITCGLYSGGLFTLESGAVNITAGDAFAMGSRSVGSGFDTESFGLYANSGLAVKGGKLNVSAGRADGGTSNTSCGIYSAGALTVEGGTITATGKNSDGSYGVYIDEGGLKMTGGEVYATSGVSERGFSRGLYVLGDSVIDGGTLSAIGGGSAVNECQGIYIGENGNTFTINGGTVNAVSKGGTGNTAGLFLNSAELLVNGGEINTKGTTTENYGLRVSGTLTINGGEINTEGTTNAVYFTADFPSDVIVKATEGEGVGAEGLFDPALRTLVSKDDSNTAITSANIIPLAAAEPGGEKAQEGEPSGNGSGASEGTQEIQGQDEIEPTRPEASIWRNPFVILLIVICLCAIIICIFLAIRVKRLEDKDERRSIIHTLPLDAALEQGVRYTDKGPPRQDEASPPGFDEVDSRNRELELAEERTKEREAALELACSRILEREEALKLADERIKEREEKLSLTDSQIKEREDTLEIADNHVAEREKALDLAVSRIEEREEALELAVNRINEREEALEVAFNRIKEREQALELVSGSIKEREDALMQAASELQEVEAASETIDNSLEEHNRELELAVGQIKEREQALELAERQIKEREQEIVQLTSRLRELEEASALAGSGEKEKKAVLDTDESKVDDILSQIQPHFLYNSLVVIKQLCQEDPATAEQTVMEFSEYLRGNLESLSAKEPIPFEKELKHAEVYLALEMKRFDDRLKVVYDILVRDFFIPALTLQPVAENAVRHGISRREEGGTVSVKTSETAESYIVTVADDCGGFDVTQSGDESVYASLENVRNRVETMCGGTLEIENREGIGTAVIITIPKRGALDE